MEVFLNFRRSAISSIVRIGSGFATGADDCAGMGFTDFREAIGQSSRKIKFRRLSFRTIAATRRPSVVLPAGSLVEYGAVQTIANDLPNTTTLKESRDSATLGI